MERCTCRVFNIEENKDAEPIIKGLPQRFHHNPGGTDDRDVELGNMKKYWLAKDFNFKKIAPGIKQYYKLMSVQKGVVLVDNRIAVPTDLRQAV